MSEILGVLRVKDGDGNWINIPGLKGDTGEPFRPLGTYATAAALDEAVTDPELGDCYLVGTPGAYYVYAYMANGWVNLGQFMPKGEDGNPAPPETIVPAVEAWLLDNIDPETGYALDRTLSMSNAAAPADLVGDLNNLLTAVANNEPLTAFSETVTGVQTKYYNVSIKAGTYKMSVDSIESTDTDSDMCNVSFYSGSSTLFTRSYRRNEPKTDTYTFESDVTRIYFYASQSYVRGEGDSFTFNNFKITQETEIHKAIENKLDSVDTQNIVDHAVTVEKTAFIETEYSANLFDPATMATDAAWAYTNRPDSGGVVSIVANQYTGTYSAFRIKIPEDAEKISIIKYSGSGTLYSYYFTNENSECISYEYDVAYSLSAGRTLTVPSGATYLYVTIKNAHDYATANVMVSATDEPIAYVPYEEVYVIPGLKVEGGGGSGDWEHDATLSLPEKYELVVGDTFELFYQGIVKAAHWDVFDVEVTCAKGNAFERKYVFTPVAADIGEINCIIDLYDPYHKKMDTKTIKLVVKAKASSPESEKVVLYVGDSLANGGYAPGEFKRRLVGTDGTPAGDALSNIRFIGTCNNGYVDYEGYGGWSWQSYNTANSSNAYMWITVNSHDKTEAEDQHSIYVASNGTKWKLETIEEGRIKIIRTSGSTALPASGTLTWESGGTNHSNIVYSSSAQAAGNPFWNETAGKVDFGAYATAQGVTKIDFVYVLLGWNGSGTSEENTKAYVRTFIDNVLASFPDCQVVLLGIQCPARDGLATNYGASGTLAHFYSALNHVVNLNNWYSDVASEYQNVSFVNIAGQFDTKYNMPSTSMAVNTRNSSRVNIQSNGVHPLQSGYYQIADACWRDFHHKLQA